MWIFQGVWIHLALELKIHGSPQKRCDFGFAQIWNRLLLGPLNKAHPPHKQRHLWTRQGRGWWWLGMVGDGWWWLMGVRKLWSGKFRATSAEVSPISSVCSRGILPKICSLNSGLGIIVFFQILFTFTQESGQNLYSSVDLSCGQWC